MASNTGGATSNQSITLTNSKDQNGQSKKLEEELQQHHEEQTSENDNTDKEIEQQDENKGSTSNNNNTKNEVNNDTPQSPSSETENQNQPPPPLLESTRLKGYLTILFLSCIAFLSAYESDLQHDFLNEGIFAISVDGTVLDGGKVWNVIPAEKPDRKYAMAATGLSAVMTFLIVTIHFLDGRWLLGRTCWTHVFAPKSKIELALLIFQALWWIIAAWILTSLNGVAGDGKGQYNLYFSTWLCCLTSLYMMEKWLKAAGFSQFRESLAGWPNRAPGWIKIFISTISNFLSILDLYLNHERLPSKDASYLIEKYSEIQLWKWAFLMLTCSISILISFCFITVELFRREDEHVESIKPLQENGLEGICLVTLVALWVPSVVFATTENGAASEIGNAYFATWASAIFVIQTFIFWLRDWRRGVHEMILIQDREYKESQARVARMEEEEEEHDDEDDSIGVDNDENGYSISNYSGSDVVSVDQELNDELGTFTNEDEKREEEVDNDPIYVPKIRRV